MTTRELINDVIRYNTGREYGKSLTLKFEPNDSCYDTFLKLRELEDRKINMLGHYEISERFKTSDNEYVPVGNLKGDFDSMKNRIVIERTERCPIEDELKFSGVIYNPTFDAENALTKIMYKHIANSMYGMSTWGYLAPSNIKKVIFNDPATIVLWRDGSKTIVKCGENDIFDPEKGLAMAIVKKCFGNQGNYFNQIKKWTDGYEPKIDFEKLVDDGKFDRVNILAASEVAKLIKEEE